jgi:formylglycine-generating enzyme required for sulfatase activity
MLPLGPFACILILAVTLLPAAQLRAQEQAAQPGVGAGPAAAADPVQEAGLSLEQQQSIENALAAAARAEREGRLLRPANDSAVSHLRSVLQIDPGNPAAHAGLARVQEQLIAQAADDARDMDYESAERLLQDAARVREDPERMRQAEASIRGIRQAYSEGLGSAAIRAIESGEFDRAERLLIELIALGVDSDTVVQLRQRLDDARVYGGLKPGQTIRDRFREGEGLAPECIIVPAGSFLMGSPQHEDGRQEHEGPEHRVTFRRGFALGRVEVTVAEFRVFVEQTRYRTDAERLGYSTVFDHQSGRLGRRDRVNWRMNYEGLDAADNEPVIHVSWNDAQAFTRWLGERTGKVYRLPTEAEFEYALRAGRQSRYWWGDGVPRRPVENLTGEGDLSPTNRQWSTFFRGYTDRYWGPAPVASFAANPFGLQDLGGNVGEWVMDCWHDTYLRAPADGAAWVNPGCRHRVVRGGYWASSPPQARSAYRISAQPDHRDARIGFRVAKDL